MSWGYTIGNNVRRTPISSGPVACAKLNNLPLQTEFIARLIRGIYDNRLSSIVAKPSAIEDFNTYVQSRVSNSIWYSPECGDSWYKDPASAKVTVPAPWGASKQTLPLLRRRHQMDLTPKLLRSRAVGADPQNPMGRLELPPSRRER